MTCTQSRLWKAFLIILAVSGGANGSTAQEAAKTVAPLHEVYGSWQIACAAIAKTGDAAATATPLCAIAQIQLEEKTRKLAMSAEFRLDDAARPDRLSGALVMPFGLAVTKLFSVKSGNVRLQEVQVSTCLPVGCIVSFTPFVELVSALKAEQTLTIEAPDLEGRIISFQLQGNGFAEALKRLENLR